MDQAQKKLRDHLNGYTDKDYARIEKGEDLSVEAPLKMKAFAEYKAKNESGEPNIVIKRMND